MKEKGTPKKATKAPDVPAPLTSVTVIYVDGNSIAAMAVSRTDAGFRVDGLEHLEVDRLLEVVKRLRHPIFMDLNFCLLPEKELIQQYFRRFVEQPAFRNPTVCLLGPEKVLHATAHGTPDRVAADARRNQLFVTNMPVNPYEYPSIVGFSESVDAKGEAETTFYRARLADFVQISQITASISDRLLGFCPGVSAANRILSMLPTDGPDQPVMLCDIGKLRTLYARRDENQRNSFNPIPVGLARDDTHYFRSISPDTQKLRHLEATIGALLFPPEATPSPLFSVSTTSPQVDCTRLALQISRYAQRAFPHTAVPGGIEPARYLTGRGSRMPGLRQYLEKKTQSEFRRLDRRPLEGVELAPGLRPGDVADNLLLLGAAIETLVSKHPSHGLFTANYKTPPMKNRRCSIPDLEPYKSYVFEHGYE